MRRSESDITLNPEWQAEQMDRLLGFEILTRALTARYHPIPPELLADKVGANKGLTNSIIVKIQRNLNEKQRPD